jgi:hypothetical protein
MKMIFLLLNQRPGRSGKGVKTMISDREGIIVLLVLAAGILVLYGAMHLTGLLIQMGVGQ